MYWVLPAMASNIAFALQDTLIYRLTALKAMNSFAVGAATHFWFALVATLGALFIYPISPKLVTPIFRGIQTLVYGHAPAVFLYSILFFVANGLLYEAYTLGAQLNNTNPGVASTLSNMSLILSAGLPAWLLGKKLSYMNCVGIILYLFAAYLLVSDPLPPKEQTGTGKLVVTDVTGRVHLQWVACCLGAALLYGLAAFCAFLIVQSSNVHSNAALTYSLFVTESAIGLALYLLMLSFPEIEGVSTILAGYTRAFVQLFTTPKDILGVVPASMLGGAGIFALYNSYLVAPNPGFADAVSNLYTATQSLIAWYIYGTPLSNGQLAGLGVAVLSIGLLSV